MKRKQHFQIYFTITLILKPDKDTTRKENCKVPLMDIDVKILNKVLVN